MKTYYNELDPPKKGNGKKIWDAFKKAGFEVLDLHYNANCWYTTMTDGRGTWVCRIRNKYMDRGFFCGIDKGKVYVMTMNAPYNLLYMGEGNERLLCQM